MSTFHVSDDVPDDALVTRLRAAGCVFAEDEARLLRAAAGTPDELAAMAAQRIGGLPLEQVLGWAEFRGLRIAVEPGVFVPRRRTEFLVERAVEFLTRRTSAAPGGPVLVDLCCGSGAVGVALVVALTADAPAPDGMELHAADLDPVAVRCAGRNLAAVGGHVHQGDLYEPLPADLRGRVDILVANAPYVPSAAVGLMPAEARVHEPRLALDGGPDGLNILRRVATAAPQWLAPGGHLLVESSERQAPQLVEAVAAGGLLPQVARDEERGATVVIGTLAARQDRRAAPAVPTTR